MGAGAVSSLGGHFQLMATHRLFLLSFERLLLHAICQYMDLISASKCLGPETPNEPIQPEKTEARWGLLTQPEASGGCGTA